MFKTATPANKLALLLPVGIVLYFSYLARGYQLDDALIYLRYIKNFQGGEGLVYNPGERFNGLTSPLFTYVILGVSYFCRDLQMASMLTSCVFMITASILGAMIFSRSAPETAFIAAVVGLFGYFYTTFGMETPMFLTLIALSVLLHERRSVHVLTALALLMITRSEGVFLAVVLVLDDIVRRRRLPKIEPLVLASAILCLPFIFNYLYYGAFLPATGNAKIGQGKSGYWGDGWIFLHVGYLKNLVFAGSYLAAGSFALTAAFGVAVLRRERSTLLMLAFAILLLTFYTGMNIPNYHWYYAPFIYISVIFSGKGMFALMSRALDRRSDYRHVALFIALAGSQAYALSKVVPLRERGAFANPQAYVDIGKWLERNTAPNASVGLVEIGTVGWHSGRNIIDILGLVNPYNADLIARRDLFGWLTHYRPDYILRHEPRWVFEKSTAVLEDGRCYLPAPGADFPGYVILARTARCSDADITRMATEAASLEPGKP